MLPFPLPRILTALLFGGCVFALAGTAQTVSRDSPFSPAGGAVTAPLAQSGDHELVGIIAMSRQTLVGITERASRKSHWIPVGKTVDGIEVISCDAEAEKATVRIGGELKTLAMKVSMPSGAAPAHTPAPGTPVAAQRLTTQQAEQEREARMLVSDLLEIGIQQRKAYEEAQRKAGQKQ